MFQELNISQEDFIEAQREAGRQGEISWLEVASRIRDSNQAFGEGLVEVGNFEGALSRLIETGGTGTQALIQLQNIGIEASEAGITSLQGLEQQLIATGEFTAGEIQALMSSFSTNGISGIEQLVNASEDDLINLVASFDAALQDSGTSWDALIGQAEETMDILNRLDGAVVDIEYNGVFTGNHPDGLSSGGFTSTSTSGPSLGANATGLVVKTPTQFSVGGRSGLLGEAGAEGILPLASVGGKLGVNATGLNGAGNQGQVVINVDARNAQAGVEAEILNAVEILEDRILTQVSDMMS